MRALTTPLRFTAAACLAAAIFPAFAEQADHQAACERSARQALAPAQGPAPEVTFNAPPAVEPRLSGDGQTVLRGSGRARSAAGVRGFTYSCNVDTASGDAVGVVIRNTTPVPAAATQRAAAVEPDLSKLSPEACESRAAAALKQRWPGVSQINFDAATRTLRQDTTGRAELRGQGFALPTPTSPSTHFGFDCVIDPRDGKVLSTRVTG